MKAALVESRTGEALLMSSHVLVVDDEEPICTLLRRQLELWGYAVEIALNASEALDRMASEPASIAIIDIRMPGRDGLWLAEQIRQRWNNTAIVVVTGADDVGSIEKSRQSGVVDDYVLKPFNRDVLQETLIRASKAAGH